MRYSNIVLALGLSIMSGSLMAQSTGTGSGAGGTGTGTSGTGTDTGSGGTGTGTGTDTGTGTGTGTGSGTGSGTGGTGTGTGGTGTGTGGTGTGSGGTGTGGTGTGTGNGFGSGTTSTGAAYAASCLTDPLPTTPTGPTWTETLDVPTMTSTGTASGTEPVTITFWREVCSGGGSATVGLLQRSQQAGNSGTFAEFPGLTIQQGSQNIPVRAAGVPNTQSSSIVAGTPIANQQSFVLENAAPGDTTSFTGTSDSNFSSAMTLGFNAGGSNAGTPLNISAYDPNIYPTAILSMQITGYNTGNYFNPQHAGEGIQIEVGSLSSALVAGGTGGSGASGSGGNGGSGGTGTGSCSNGSGSGSGSGSDNGTGSGSNGSGSSGGSSGSGGSGSGSGGSGSGGSGSGSAGSGSGSGGSGSGSGGSGSGSGGSGSGGSGSGSGGSGSGSGGGSGSGAGGSGSGSGGSGSGSGTGTGGGSSICTTAYITVAWYTYDSNGMPYWLFGMSTLNRGDRSASVPMMNSSDGGFAGNFNQATSTEWGNLVIDFPNCNTMHFTFTANDGLADGVPTGSGDLDWQRLTQIQGLVCQ